MKHSATTNSNDGLSSSVGSPNNLQTELPKQEARPDLVDLEETDKIAKTPEPLSVQCPDVQQILQSEEEAPEVSWEEMYGHQWNMQESEKFFSKLSPKDLADLVNPSIDNTKQGLDSVDN